VPGYSAYSAITIPLSGASVPASLARIELEVSVAGEDFTESFGAAPNESTGFQWDGKDGFGRTVQGTQLVSVRVGYVYPAVYLQPDEIDQSFAGVAGSPITGSEARQEITVWQGWSGQVSRKDARGEGLGGWSLDVHAVYDSTARQLVLGDGTRSGATVLGSTIQTAAGGGASTADRIPATQASISPYGHVAVAADGSLYFADNSSKVRRVGPNGIITTVAGTDTGGYSGDGGPATAAQLQDPTGVAVGPDGSVYIADSINQRVRRVGPDGIITTVAGTGTGGYSGDGGPATQAKLAYPESVAVGPDGSLYIADASNFRVRRVGPDGITTTVAGNGTEGFSGDGGQATQAEIDSPNGVAVGPDGVLYIADTINSRIRRVGPDGIITTVAGSGTYGHSGDGGPATAAQLTYPLDVAVGRDGSLYVAETDIKQHPNFNDQNGWVRRVAPDGTITTVAGNGTGGTAGDGGPAVDASLGFVSGVDVAPDGSLAVSSNYERIRRVGPALPGLPAGDFVIPAEDGSELYAFDVAGRHLRTVDALTGALRYQFGYDSADRLASVTDGDGNVTIIQRDTNSNPTAIVAPGGQPTTLTLDANGYLASITDPAANATQLVYGQGGLLATLTNARGGVSHYTYDAVGRLTKDTDAAGGFKALTPTEAADGQTVTVTDALGRTISDQHIDLPGAAEQDIDTDASGLQTVTQTDPDGSSTVTAPDGAVTTIHYGPDPRFGMEVPLVASMTVTTSAGLKSTYAETRTVTLSDPDNPLSLTAETDTTTINGQTSTVTFDAAARTLTAGSPGGRTQTTLLDAKGHVVQTQTAGLDPVQFSYDAHGHLTSVTQGARSEMLTYDAQGNVASVTDPLSHTETFGYDPAGKVVQQTLTDGSQLHYSYDANGNLTALTPPGQPAHTMTYTAVNLLQDATAPDAGAGTDQTQYVYNADRQLTQVTRPDGTTVGLTYDAVGRLTTLTLPQGQETTTYDPATGNPLTVTAPGGETITYGYTGGLPTDATWSGAVAGSVHATLDANFRVTAETVNGANPVNFQYDGDGLVTQAGPLTLSRDPNNGRLTGSALGSVADTLTYDSLGEVAAYQASAGATGLYSAQDTYDLLGRVSQQTEVIGGVSHTDVYTYDAASRLTQVTQDGVSVAEYTYDANGNRLTYTGPGGTVTANYDAQDRLVRDGTLSYTYTANGELQTRTDSAANQTTHYTYDALGNLLAVVLPNGTHIDYVVDGQNRRVGKKVNDTLVQGFLYDDALHPVAELDAAGNVVGRFVYANANTTPDYMVKAGVTYRILTDHLGSPRLVVNTVTGQVVQRLDYDAFGNVTTDTNPGFQPFGYAGGLYDRDTGLLRFGVRDYDPATGRWLAKDPVGFDGGSANLYSYVGNDPVNALDPNGLEGHTGGHEGNAGHDTGPTWAQMSQAGLPGMHLYVGYLVSKLEETVIFGIIGTGAVTASLILDAALAPFRLLTHDREGWVHEGSRQICVTRKVFETFVDLERHTWGVPIPDREAEEQQAWINGIEKRQEEEMRFDYLLEQARGGPSDRSLYKYPH
jgi:RHS repeat-associated protein